MRALRKPIVAALNGTAAGAGAVIALASDLRVASEKAKIAFLFVKVGLAGADMGAAFGSGASATMFGSRGSARISLVSSGSKS
jgi:enoyl-CoA hydratase/carnithine racemase